MMSDIRLTIEELHMDGSISLGDCSKSTVYYWRNRINEILKAEKYDWRVKADIKTKTLHVI